jgi:hypothetical protein
MQTAIIEEVYDYLTFLGLVNYTSGWDCFVGFMPDDQDQTIGLYETGGFPADTLLRENQRLTFQVHIRGARRDYGKVRNRWQMIFYALQDADSQTAPPLLPGVVFIQAMHYGPMTFTEEKGRVAMTMNFRAMTTGGIDIVPDIMPLSVPPLAKRR